MNLDRESARHRLVFQPSRDLVKWYWFQLCCCVREMIMLGVAVADCECLN